MRLDILRAHRVLERHAHQRLTVAAADTAGGTTEWPTYESIGDHTECVMVRYDPAVLSYPALIDWFFQNHSWRSNNTSYPQYMNGCWVHDDEQAAVVQEAVSLLPGEVETVVAARTPFYRAEEYHQKFYAKQNFGGSAEMGSCGAGTQALF